MSQFSIIVPFENNVSQFEDTLASVLRHRPNDSQIIVIHGGDYEDPYSLDSEVKFVQADFECNFVERLNIALCYASGALTVLVRPGIQLDEGWESNLNQQFLAPEVGAVAGTVVANQKPNRVQLAGVELNQLFTRRHCGRNLRVASRRFSKLRPWGPTSWLGVYRTSLLKTLAPLDDSLEPFFWDAEIALSLRSLGFTCRVDSTFIGLADELEFIDEEREQAHGLSSQRAMQRFPNQLSGNLFGAYCLELLSAPMYPWKLRHWFSRFSARKFYAADRQFAAELKARLVAKPWLREEPTVLAFESKTERRRAA